MHTTFCIDNPSTALHGNLIFVLIAARAQLQYCIIGLPPETYREAVLT